MVIKKTVAIHPKMDRYIRITWARLIELGYDASYSTALNYMLLGHILTAIEKPLSKKVVNDLSSFLADAATVGALDLEDYGTRVDELFERRQDAKDKK